MRNKRSLAISALKTVPSVRSHTRKAPSTFWGGHDSKTRRLVLYRSQLTRTGDVRPKRVGVPTPLVRLCFETKIAVLYSKCKVFKYWDGLL